MKSRLENIYKKEISDSVKNELKIQNVHLIPRIQKVVINTGVKEAVHDQKALNGVVTGVSAIAGQKAVKTIAKKSIASFKVREGIGLGVKVTLRNTRMYDFLDKLINVALPCVRDFRGVKANFDGNGNFNLGVKDWMIFPEIEFDKFEGGRGLNISIITSAKDDNSAKVLLKRFGIPFA